MKHKKVGIIGVGNVGSTLAFSLAMNQTCNEILLKDIREDFVEAMSLDISQAAKASGSHTVAYAISKPEDFKQCDIVVITAGIARKPGMSRDDLLLINAKIMQSVVEETVLYNQEAIIIVVSNPLDAMVHIALTSSGFPRNRVIGMAGILDSARMAHFIAQKLENKNLLIEASVMGGHGDDMVPLPQYSSVDGKPLVDVLSQEDIADVITKTKHGGAQIVGLLKTGSAYYAPGRSIAIMVEAILNDTQKVYPCAVRLEGEYGYENSVAGVPIRLGKNGCEEVILLGLNASEKEQFLHSVNSVRELVNTLEDKFFK